MVNDLPVRYYTDNSLTAPLNWYWAPDNQSQEMNFLLYYPHQRLGRSLEALEPGLALDEDYLAARFHGNTSQVVAIVFQPPACLRVLDAGVDYDNRMLTAELQAAALLSSSQWISIEGPDAADRLPAALYGAEPAHGWCYYFSQAELARQEEDWEQVAELGNLAFNLDDKPNDPVERLVFIEGYAHTGEWNRAEELSRQALEITPMMNPLICHVWERIDRDVPDSLEKKDSLEQVTSGLNCEG